MCSGQQFNLSEKAHAEVTVFFFVFFITLASPKVTQTLSLNKTEIATERTIPEPLGLPKLILQKQWSIPTILALGSPAIPKHI